MASGKNKKRTGKAAESSTKASHSDKKTPKSLKPEPKIVKKSSTPNSTQLKEEKNTSQVEARNKDEKKPIKIGKQDGSNIGKKGGRNLNSPHGNKEKKIINEKSGENSGKDGGRNLNSPHGNKEKKIINGKSGENSGKSGGRNLNSPHGNKEKKIINEKSGETSNRDQKSEKTLGGLIFMCNAKTKPDCYRYRVMGLPSNKQELVTVVKPGLKLFLYDFDLKLMYGIYKASSAGGMKLEPAAFGGAFPVQVRFEIHKDCRPLPESVFKKAIKEDYNEKTHKFKTELTVQQVKKLTQLFRPAPWHSNAQSSIQEPVPAPIIYPQPAATAQSEVARREQVYRDHHSSSKAVGNLVPAYHERNQSSKHPILPRVSDSPDPLFLTEKEYRSYGLRRERHVMTNAAAPVSPALDPYSTHQERERILMNPASINGDATLVQNEAFRHDPRFLSEKEYRAYGLGVQREQPPSMTPIGGMTTTALNKYPEDQCHTYHYDTNSLVERYLTLPRAVAAPPESYSQTARQNYISNPNYIERDTRNHTGRLVPNEAERSYSTYASHMLSDYNQNYHDLRGEPEYTSTSVPARYSSHLGGEPEYASTTVSSRYSHMGREPEYPPTTVSSRYSFGGPALPYR
ncbi:uncharacterized protein LOC132306964 [Cornus florida]|uniref:uncharacterized protein LOC132306964 n=1 Tax=Cornus florida TaxID=4283 RepID=UPI00289BB118|nr:uncharacterized protein LOC132306964 [Cornus florida]